MLFRPYKPVYVGQYQLPFTPGLIPSNQERLAQRISNAIMGSLLTPNELRNLARRLLETERMKAAIRWLLEMALEQIKVGNEQKTAKILASILKDFLGESLPRLVKVWARREDFLEPQLNQIFDQVLLEIQLTETQTKQLSNWLLQVVLPADSVRLVIIDFLTDRNIQVIDEGFREKTSGTYWVVANLLGLRNTLVRLRTYLLDEKETSNALINEFVQTLGVRERLEEVLQNLSLQNLPVSTVRQLRKSLRDAVRSYIQTRGMETLRGLSGSIDWEHFSALLLNRLRTSEAVTSSLEPVSTELALILEHHLEKDLEAIVAKAIPIMNLDQVIIDRVKATAPQDLELAIQEIVRSELQAIVNLGGILGFLIGFIQVIVFLVQGSLV